jgi:hypothetical protein
VQARRSSAVSGWQAALTTVFVLVAFLIGVVSGRRLSDEAPPPIVNVAPLVSPAAQVSPIVVAASPAASAASPAPIGLRLSADASAPQPVARQAPSPSPAPTPLQTRCADAAQRFPETSDTEAAVRAAYREFLARQGVAVDAGTALFGGLGEAYAARHAEIVAGWMAVTLQRERRGLATFPLADYVASDIVVATGPGEYQMRATVSPQGWAEIRSWPADTCEGAFIRNPANARWVESMQASVGDISWALPTPAGR